MSEARLPSSKEKVPDAWDDYEEDGPLDLEEQLDRALDSAFNQESQRQGDLIDLFRQEY